MNTIIKCPTCGESTEYDQSNKWRPFCCERCKLIDLGEWAKESYRVPTDEEPLSESMENTNN